MMCQCAKDECKYDMDPEFCAERLGHTTKPDKVAGIGPEFAASRQGRCGHCDERFPEDTLIRAATVDGERAWVIAAHTF